MKIFLLSPPSSIHTKRWAEALAQRGNDVFLFGLHPLKEEWYSDFPNISLFCMPDIKCSFKIVAYVKYLLFLKNKISEISPDVLHAHYATSYGLLGALSNFHPFIISVWGSDVYDFPQISIIHKLIVKFNLRKADRVLSTSNVMAKETRKYTRKEIEVTPFGVDTSIFKKLSNSENLGHEFVVGNVKTLSYKYGIDILIQSFYILVQSNPTTPMRLEIIGDGPDKEELVDLTRHLGLEDKVLFRGKIANHLLPQYYNSFSVSVLTSVLNSESFGVAAVEAMACECPVVASDADGFTEVVKSGETGFIVPKHSPSETASAIQRFLDDCSLRSAMGEAGRKRVLELYDWHKNVTDMISIYKKAMNKD